MLRGGFIVAACLAGAAHRLQRAALPVLAARDRDRVRGVVADPREVLIGRLRVVGEAQRDPAGSELVLGARIVFGRRQRIARHHVSGLMFTLVEKLACDEAPLGPPLLKIMLLRGAARGGLQQPRGLDRLVLAAQQLRLVEQVSGVAACALAAPRRAARGRSKPCPRQPCAPGRSGGRCRRAIAPCACRRPARRHRSGDPCAPCDRRASAPRRRSPSRHARPRPSRCPRARPGARAARRPGCRPGRAGPAPARTCPWRSIGFDEAKKAA